MSMDDFIDAVWSGDTLRFALQAHLCTKLSQDALFERMHPIVAKGTTEMLSVMLDTCVDVHIRNEDGCTLLHVACIERNTEAVEFFVNQGLFVDSADLNGYTALQYSCIYEYEEEVKILVARGANIHERTPSGNTPLHLVRGYNTVLLKYLAQVCANTINVQNTAGHTPLHNLCIYGLNNGDEVVSLLLDNGADINARDTEGNTPLHLATKHSKHSYIRALLEHGADVDLTNIYGKKYTQMKKENLSVRSIW